MCRLPFPALLLAGLLAVGPVWSQPSTPEPFAAKVVGVHDGDTLTVLRMGNQQVKIRLHGVDAPELDQAHGNAAKQFASEKVFGLEVTVRPRETDRYGRTVAEILAPDGKNLGEDLLRAGYGWWYYQYAAADRRLGEAELDARGKRLGLWRDDNPMPPWAFRREPRKSGPEGTQASAPGYAVAAEVHATKGGAKYHRIGCRVIAERWQPLTVADAKAKGLTACSVCKP